MLTGFWQESIMNSWAKMLAETPSTLQRCIARAQRVSLPRGASPDIRLERLRAAFCHARTVQVTYFGLPPNVQAAMQELRGQPGGIAPEELAARFGPIRPWSQIAQNLKPQTVSEQLVLLGWLLPRPAAPYHPPRYLLPPELRAWLPQPLVLDEMGIAPPAPVAPALHAAAVVLLACAEQPLPLRRNGEPRAASLRLLTARLAPASQANAQALFRFVLPLLIDMGLLAPHGAAAVLAPAGARFLSKPAAWQLARLRAAWVRAPRPDAYLRPLLLEDRGMDWPLFRRRLLAWAAALPTQRLLDPQPLYAALAASLGPLADAQTHGFRVVERVPWRPKRASAIWDAALRGPLTWLGSIAWDEAASHSAPHCFATPAAGLDIADTDADQCRIDAASPLPDAHASPPSTWRYGEPGVVHIPHADLNTAVLRLMPYARWHGADATQTSYQITAATLRAALSRGHDTSVLWVLLERYAGPLPLSWRETFAVPSPAVHLIHGAVIWSDQPAVLEQAAQSRNVRRYLQTRLAPGVALVDPQRAATLTRTLERRDLAVEQRGCPTAAPPAQFTAAECATLLATCAVYRRQAPDGVAPGVLDALEERLRAALPAALRTATTGCALPHQETLDLTAPDVFSATNGELRPSNLSAMVIEKDIVLSTSDTEADSQELLEQQADSTTQDLHTGSFRRLIAHVGTSLHTRNSRWEAARLAAYGSIVRCLLAPMLLCGFVSWLLLATFGRRPRLNAAHVEDTPLPSTKASALPGRASSDQECVTDTDTSVAPVFVFELRRAIAQRRAIAIAYQAADEHTPTRRIVRPLLLEGHGPHWYLHAYCTLRQAERLFRVDRIHEVHVLDKPAHRREGLDRRKRRVPATPRPYPKRAKTSYLGGTGFFRPPPDPPPGSPLVRIWLEE
jgi:hypothetical protein